MIERVVFLDNTVLTNFALIGHPDLIFSLWPGIACTTKQVMQEYQAGVKSSRLPVEAWGDLPVYELADAEMAKATELPSQLGAGERTCLAAAVQRQGIFASDDQQAPNDMNCHSVIEERPLVEWPALFAGRIETKGAVELLASMPSGSV